MSPRKRQFNAKRDLVGYCWKCGGDVLTDYCDKCGIYVQPSPHEKPKPGAKGDAND